jgi:DNA gyrase subunit A
MKYIVFVTENGIGKKVNADEFKVQSRGGKGLIGINTDERSGKLVDTVSVNDNQKILITTSNGISIKINVNDINPTSRISKGVYLIKPVATNKVESVTVCD